MSLKRLLPSKVYIGLCHVFYILHDLFFLMPYFSTYRNRGMTRKIKYTRHIAIFKMYTSFMVISRLYEHQKFQFKVQGQINCSVFRVEVDEYFESSKASGQVV